MKRRLLLIVAFLLPASLLLAQTVDRDEFSDTLATTINFVNFSGTYGHIDTLDQILAIGRGIAQGLTRDRAGTFSYAERYTIIHVLGTPEEKGKAADILLFSAEARVDHIDNVRRIISAYLSSMYGYKKSDADILAFFITVYNAVHRGNLVFYQGRYKASVQKYLSADKVGLSLRYDEWPGKTQILIPLSLVASQTGKDSLSAVSAESLVTPEVIDTVRDKPKSGTEERKKLADLMDKSIDQEQNAIDQRKRELDAELLKNQEKQKQLEAAQAEAAKNNSASTTTTVPNGQKTESSSSTTTTTPNTTESSKSSNSDTTPTSSVQTETDAQKLKKQEEQIKNEQKQLDQRQEEVKNLADATKTLRESTAADLKNQGKENATLLKPTVVLKARLEKGLLLSQALKIIPNSSEIVAQSATDSILGRHVFSFGENWLALDGNESAASLVLLADKDLSLVKKGSSRISPWSELVLVNGGKECLAILQDEGEWYLGRFDLQLNPVARSAIPVDPVGALMIQGESVFVQRKDGRISQLNLADLHIGK